MPIRPKHNIGCICCSRYLVRYGLRSIGMLQQPPKCSGVGREVALQAQQRQLQRLPAAVDDETKWRLQLDILGPKNTPQLMSLPMLIYLYSPWKCLDTKLNLWKLKLLWDRKFVEEKFVENSKQALVVITDIIRQQQPSQIARCTTPMGYKQIQQDLLDMNASMNKDMCLQMLRFQRQHIRRALPLKVRLLRHYNHKFAFIDMLFVAMRRTNDFQTAEERGQMSGLLQAYQPSGLTSNNLVTHPIIFAEIFVRFRRDYSANPNGVYKASEQDSCCGKWLVSNYKVMAFEVQNFHPEFYCGKATHCAID